MFARANEALGANWSLHDLRHSAAYRLARDPQMPITDVQWVLGHAPLSTTQRYVSEGSGIASEGREAAGRLISGASEWSCAVPKLVTHAVTLGSGTTM
jgi:integrase